MSSKGWHSQDSTQARHGEHLIKGDGFGGRSIAMLTPKVNTEIRLLIGASGADTHGAMWNVRIYPVIFNTCQFLPVHTCISLFFFLLFFLFLFFFFFFFFFFFLLFSFFFTN